LVNRFGTFRIGTRVIGDILSTHERVTFRPIVVPVVVVVVVMDVAVVGGAVDILHYGGHGGTPSLAESLQQRRQG